MEINKGKKTIIMGNGNRMEVKYKSELLEQIRQDLDASESESSDIDPGFFNEEDVWSLYEFLLMRHKDDWVVFDDMEGNNYVEDSYYEEECLYEEEKFDDYGNDDYQ